MFRINILTRFQILKILFIICFIFENNFPNGIHFYGCNAEENTQEHKCWNDIQQFYRICYYTDWSSYREGKGRFTPDDIEPELCTHVMYSFAILNDTTLNEVIPADEYLAITQDFYGKITKLKENNIKVMLSVGGWVDSTSKYSQMLNDVNLRKGFVSSLGKLVIKHGFDGAELDIEYPGFYQMDSTQLHPEDKENFVTLLYEIRKHFDEIEKSKKLKNKLLMSMAVSGNEKVVEISYDVHKITEVCDWVSVLAYDMHSFQDKFTGLNAPFSVQPGDKGAVLKYNAQSMMNVWLTNGAPQNKLVLGIPFYGQTFSLDDEKVHDLLAPASGTPSLSKYTKSPSTMSFYEILENVKNDTWSVVHKNSLGSYAYKNKEWVGYDDKYDVAVKAAYVRMNCFLGVMVWSLDFDCFQKDYPNGRYPLLTTIKDVLTGAVPYTNVENLT